MLTIYGSIISTCTSRVLASLLALGLVENKDFKLHNVKDLFEIRKPEWIANQPFSQMPYAVDEETSLVIYESRAIVRYAAAKYAPGSPYFPLASENIEDFAKFEIGASVETANFDPIVKDLYMATFFKIRRGIELDKAEIEGLETKLKGKLEGYERLLSKQEWIGGDRPTLVDLFHLPCPNILLPIGYAQGLVDGSFPKVADWWKRVNELDAWKGVLEAKAREW